MGALWLRASGVLAFTVYGGVGWLMGVVSGCQAMIFNSIQLQDEHTSFVGG